MLNLHMQKIVFVISKEICFESLKSGKRDERFIVSLHVFISNRVLEARR